MSGRFGRSQLYKMLAEFMGIHRASCHIGYFNLEKCKKVIEFVNHIEGAEHATERTPDSIAGTSESDQLRDQEVGQAVRLVPERDTASDMGGAVPEGEHG